MSLYNTLNGYNPACVLILPMLGRRQMDCPRFRDCFVTKERNIAIYTRVGGNNATNVIMRSTNITRKAECVNYVNLRAM